MNTPKKQGMDRHRSYASCRPPTWFDVVCLSVVLFVTGPALHAQNLAADKPTTASSAWVTGYPPSYACDTTATNSASATSRWLSSSYNDNWIYVDLGAVMGIGRVKLTWHGQIAYGRDYRIQVSNIPSSVETDWTTIATVTGGDGGVDDLYVSGRGQYIRMRGDVRGTSTSGYSLLAFEVYPPLVTITVNAAATPTRTDITNKTFGSGADYHDLGFKTLVESSTGRPSVRNLNLGSFRFPNGDGSKTYYWKEPAKSMVADAANYTPDQIYSFTSAGFLNMPDLLFQVNTYAYVNSSGYTTLNNAAPGAPPSIYNTARDFAARNAAEWVTDNLGSGRPLEDQVKYWEVGNEDWSNLTPELYAQVLNEFTARMKTAAQAATGNAESIKLLAQSFTGSWSIGGGLTNGPDWVPRMISAMTSPDRARVYALSEHLYLKGGKFLNEPDHAKGRALQTRNMFGRLQNNFVGRLQTLKGLADGVSWKVWVTEFNVWPMWPDGQGELDGGKTLGDMGHALVIADWVGMMLEQGVERMFMHSLDNHPGFGLVQYVHQGGTPQAPVVTGPGRAYSKYAWEFGPNLVSNSVVGNPRIAGLTAADGGQGDYDQIKAYTSLRGNSMRIMVVNRSLENGAYLTLKAAPGRTVPVNSPYTLATLKAATIDAKNSSTSPDAIAWEQTYPTTSSTGTVVVTVTKASVTFLSIPLN